MGDYKNMYIVDLGVVDPFFNLAIEEYLYTHYHKGDYYLFLWQNDKSVILGQGQSVYSQCNIELINKLGINIVRRRSGGGAVYHDLGNLNYSFITEHSNCVSNENLNYICKTLQNYGIAAVPSGRNDITANGRKFSGNAYVSDGYKICHHGTLLIDSDLSIMHDILNVPERKWKDKGIDSARSRTVNLSSLNSNVTVANLKKSLKDTFIAELKIPNMLNITSLEEIVADIDELNRIHAFYKSDSWRFEKKLEESLVKKQWYRWGNLELGLKLEKGKISDIRIYSDMIETDIIPILTDKLKGISFNQKSICQSLDEIITLANQEIVEDIKKVILYEMIDL